MIIDEHATSILLNDDAAVAPGGRSVRALPVAASCCRRRRAPGASAARAQRRVWRRVQRRSQRERRRREHLRGYQLIIEYMMFVLSRRYTAG